MALESLPSQMDPSTKAIGKKENTTGKAYTKPLGEPDMMENGLQEGTMGSVPLCGLTEAYLKESGKIVEKMVRESSKE